MPPGTLTSIDAPPLQQTYWRAYCLSYGMKTFVRITEVWVPTDDGSSLVLSSGLFPGVAAFEAITRQMNFARGEGLPGRAWEAGHPLMLRQLAGSYFKRAAAARAIDLTCAVAIPVFQHNELRCVVVLLMGGAPSSVGSVELWRHDSRLSSDMTLVAGYFGTTRQASELESLTLDGWLPRGAGAPGLAWQKRETVCIPDIAGSKHFLRKEVALALGIGRALAIPCSVKGENAWVLALLSAASAPIALRVEVWRADENRADTLVRSAGYCETLGSLPCASDQARALVELGPIGQAWHAAVAQAEALQWPDTGISAEQRTMHSAGISSVLALPVLDDDVVNEVVALYF